MMVPVLGLNWGSAHSAAAPLWSVESMEKPYKLRMSLQVSGDNPRHHHCQVVRLTFYTSSSDSIRPRPWSACRMALFHGASAVCSVRRAE